MVDQKNMTFMWLWNKPNSLPCLSRSPLPLSVWPLSHYFLAGVVCWSLPASSAPLPTPSLLFLSSSLRCAHTHTRSLGSAARSLAVSVRPFPPRPGCWWDEWKMSVSGLKAELKFLESIFDPNHERFRIIDWKPDELSCQFNVTGEKLLIIHCNITVRFISLV